MQKGYFKTNIEVLKFDNNKDIDKIIFNHYITKKVNYNNMNGNLPKGQFYISNGTVSKDLNISIGKAKRLIKNFKELNIIKLVQLGNTDNKPSVYEYGSNIDLGHDLGHNLGYINKDVSNYSSTLVLNVGTNDGIKENMTVIADKGLVGHVISVSDNTCKVQVIIDSASTVSSSISTTQESIICKGTLENDQILRATYIPTGAELIQGDSVYTSGIGGIYPKGIIIGTIKEIVTTSNITDRYAIVEPAVDFSKIDTVLIINE